MALWKVAYLIEQRITGSIPVDPAEVKRRLCIGHRILSGIAERLRHQAHNLETRGSNPLPATSPAGLLQLRSTKRPGEKV